MVYEAKWGFIPAGEAVIEILPTVIIRGTKAYHFVMTVTTNSQIDMFYKIREQQDSYADIALTRTLEYQKKSTGKHPRDTVVTFNWEDKTTTYWGFGKAEVTVPVLPGSVDPLALFFVIRTHRLKVGEVIEIPVTNGKRCITVKATVTRRETITIGTNVHDTYLVIPDMERLEGILGKKGEPELMIWFSADEKQVPVKIKSKVAVGSFVFDLVSATF